METGKQNMIKRFFMLAGKFVLLLPALLSAFNYGKISGSVTDEATGETMFGVNVIVEGTAQGAATDGDGAYLILQIPPGSYTLKANMIGYDIAVIPDVVISSNRITHLDFVLRSTVLGGEAVEVIGTRPLIEKDLTATARNISSEDMAYIPSTTVGDLLASQAGVVDDNGLHFRGGRSGEVTFYIDGVPMVDPLYSDIQTQTVISSDAISEMQVISGTYSAEYGNAMSGIINITSAKGSDQFRGWIDQKMSGLSGESYSTDYNRSITNLSLSGPIIKGKTHFYTSLTMDGRDNYLPWGYRNQNKAFFKFTDTHLKQGSLRLIGNFSTADYKNYSHSWKYIPDQNWTIPHRQSSMLSTGYSRTVSEKGYLDLLLYRSSYHYDSGDFDLDSLTAEYRRDEAKEFLTQATVSSYEENDQSTLGLKGTVVYQPDRNHEIKGGFEFKQHHIENFHVRSPFYQNHGLDAYTKEPNELAAFLQDKIDFSSLILSAGLRLDRHDANTDYWESPYDAETGDESLMKHSQPHVQISPRLGVSYPVSDVMVFHFGYGHYFQKPEYQFIYRGQADSNARTLYDADEDGDIDYADNMLMILMDGNGRYGDPNLKPEKTIAYEFGLSRQVGRAWMVQASVYSKRYTNLLGTRTFYAGEAPEWWETWILHINEDFAYNNGLELQISKRGGKHLLGELNYTYAVAEGSSSGPLERVGNEEANRQTLRFFPLGFDQRHTLSGSLTALFGKLTSTLLIHYGSGLPYTRGIRGATEPYEVNNERLPATFTMDLLLDYDLKVGPITLTPYLEIYNLENRRNVVNVDSFTGKPDFIEGRSYDWAANPENWDSPRIIYLGLTLKN